MGQTWIEWSLLPCETTFQFFERDKESGSYYPTFADLWVVFPLTIAVSLFRVFVAEGLCYAALLTVKVLGSQAGAVRWIERCAKSCSRGQSSSPEGVSEEPQKSR